MALVLKDRVKETSTTTGTGSLTLLGASTGYQTFSTAIGNGNTTYYTIQNAGEWEVGIGTVSAGALSRDTVLASSTGAKVSFSAGTKDVFCTYPAGKSVYADASGYVSGYTIENSAIGATTASTGKFTSVTTPSVTASSTDLTLSAISTGAVKFNTLNGEQVRISDSANTGQYTSFSRNVSQNIQLVGGMGTANLGLYSTGGGVIRFFTESNLTKEQFRVNDTASAVNYVQVTGNATTNAPSITSQGSDSAVAMVISSKGAGNISFWSYGSANRQFVINGANASVNYHQVAGSVATQAPIYSVGGTDTNISMAFQPKGTGAIDLAAGSSGVNISNGGTVTALTRTNVGAGYTSVPTITISAPTTAGGVQATASVTSMGINVGNISSGGTGYAVNDEVLVSGGTFTTQARYRVTAVSGGVVTAIAIISDPNYQSLPTNPASTTAVIGTGSGLTININWAVTGQSITNAGSGYIEQPTVTFSGGGGSGASAYATVGSQSIIRSIGNQLSIYNPSGETVRFADSGTPNVNYIYMNGSGTGGSPRILATGVDANINFVLGTQGAGSIRFTTASFNTDQLRVSHTASAVNYVQVTGAATTGAPIVSAQGSDTNITMFYQTKGVGSHVFGTRGTTQQFRVTDTGSAVNYGTVTGGIAGAAPKFGVEGSDTNIDLALTPKGTGVVRANGTALSAENGIILNKKTVASNVSIPSGYSALSAGAITVSSGVSVTIASGSRWVVI